jgi:cobalt/nickel transport protein
MISNLFYCKKLKTIINQKIGAFMKRVITTLFAITLCANAHFLTFLPSSDNVQSQKNSKLHFDISFIHPFEQSGMTMEKPELFLNNHQKSLPLIKTKKFEHKAWSASYDIKTPGVYQFFVQPQPYFEPLEGKFISHVPKVIISAFGIEQGWDEPLGLKYEIIPMTKPFGLYAGNSFQGVVLHHGKPASNVKVEVELYNEFNLKSPSDAHITQVVKTNANGEFSFTMNHKGWWGFAALIEEGEITHKDGKSYPVENGALIWVKAH